jgi:DNA polymerase-3 subunit alpha
VGSAQARGKKQGAPKQSLEGLTSADVLWHWCREGWKYRGLDKRLTPAQKKEYGERVKHEMELIISKDFVDYFLVLSEVLRIAKDRGIAIGPARGSSAASLVCYLIRMTEVNPMEYPLMLFERFIDPNRFDLPDVDTDIEDERRDEVRQIFIELYGEDRVGNIGTFTRFRGKNAIDDVARVYNLPKYEVEDAKNFLVERSGGDSRFDAGIEDTVAMFPQVKEIFDKYPELYNSIILEGNYKNFGVHAAGIVVGQEPLNHYVATYSKDNVGANKTSLKVLSVDKYDGEALGLLKLDALGLGTMGMIADAIKMLGMSLEELYDIPLDDKETMQAFHDADVVGIFQFEGRTTKLVVEEMHPDTFMDLAAINALSRPGPLNSGSTGEFLAIRAGRKVREDVHPMVTKICDPTEGQIIYQEQILQICGDIGKLPWTHRSAIRKIISSKQGESAFNSLWEDFRKGAMSQGIDEHVAAEIWKRMVTAGTYAFNIAHCVSYSMLGFWAMWIKVHHPREFYAAQLNKVGMKDQKARDKATLLMRDMSDSRFGRNLKVLPPTPSESSNTWKPVQEGVRAGFEQIPGVGVATAELIREFDESVGIEQWSDLLVLKGVGPGTIKKIEDFAEKEDPFDIYKIQRQSDAIRAAIKSGDLPGIPMPNCKSDEIPYEAKVSHQTVMGVLKARNLKDLFEDHRSRNGVDLDPSEVRDPHLKESMTLYLEDERGTMTVKVQRHLYPKVKDKLWEATLNHDFLVINTKKYEIAGKTIHALSLDVIDPD